MSEDLDVLERDRDMKRPDIKAGVAALRGDKDAMFAALRQCMHKSITPTQLLTFPVFEDYQGDTEFDDFVESSREGIVDRRARRQYRIGTQKE